MRKSEEETKAINSERSARFIQTRLTAAQLSEAESCFDRLAPKYSLTEAVDYFLKHFHAPDFTIGVSEASTKFRAAMEGVTSETILGCAIRLLIDHLIPIALVLYHLLNGTTVIFCFRRWGLEIHSFPNRLTHDLCLMPP